jgi:hypothetical protein
MIPQGIGPTWPTSEHDHLEVTASGRKIGETSTPELTAIFERLDIAGFAHTQGRAGNIAAFAFARAKIHDDAGRKAVQAWLAKVS